MGKKKSSKSKSSAKKTALQNAKSTSITESINTEVIAEALSAANQPVLLKLCRLCETKDGPFLNIFEADKVIAKKIEELMPFWIEENDGLPHKICFRCSAKVEELYEFVQKCIRTQVSLRKAVGKLTPTPTKTKPRKVWEEKLNKSNMSNDDICNALIQKAMEGIKDIPLNPVTLGNEEKSKLRQDILKGVSLTTENTVKTDKDTEPKKNFESGKKASEPASLKQDKTETSDENAVTTRTTRTSLIFEPLLEGLRNKKTKPPTDNQVDDDTSISEKVDRGVKRNAASKLEEKPESEKQMKEEEPAEKEKKKPFDIMEHISMIKVNGVGVLFQCKLCNRNFLKKDVVMSHSCAKNGGPKQELIPDYVPPVIPKVPTVKYINTKTDSLHPKPAIVNEKPIVVDDEPATSNIPKPKPKAGPASKVKRYNVTAQEESSDSSSNKLKVNVIGSSQITAPTVQFPAVPSINSRYKLVPGPNNTFTLVEEKVAENTEYVSSDDSNAESTKVFKDKKKSDSKSKQGEASTASNANKAAGNSIKDKAEETKEQASQPYPVGLIKKVGHHSNDYTPPVSDSVSFNTSAMKKQSYTIVQTGNPSKLLISTKPQPTQEEVPRKKIKKSRPDIKGSANDQPFSVTLEDTAPPKDSGFFTFINVDPLLQPSYVLPTDNIIQESQISTSTPLSNCKVSVENNEKEKDSKYKCNMCGESFSREKKLLTHITSHYNKMDEEDQLRGKTGKKRARK